LQWALALEIGLGTAFALTDGREPRSNAAGEEFERKTMAELHQVDFLRDMGTQELQLLLPGVTLLKLAASEIIVREGHAGDALYIIRSGEVEVTARLARARGAHSQPEATGLLW
jgi:hypothetical protein